jgi:hypothetical protein
MVGLAVFALIVGLLVVGPLAFRAWQERVRDRGLAIRADVDAALRQRLHGESLLSVQVVPETPWRTGRVEVAVPQGWDPVLIEVSAPLLARVPPRYEFVVQHSGVARLQAA